MAVAPRDGWSDAHDERAREVGHDSWADWCAHVEEEVVGHPICGGRARSDSEKVGPAPRPCTQHPYGRNGRCKHHGANAAWGPLHPAYEGKGFSRYLPGDLLRVYEEMDSSELMSLLEHMRVATTITADLLRRMDGGGGPDTWEELRGTVREIREAIRRENVGAMREGFRRLEEAVDRGAERWEVFDEVRRQQDHVRKLFDSQTRRDQVEAEYMHRRVVIALFSQVLEDIRDVVDDPDARRELGKRMMERLGRPPESSNGRGA
ncbi:MAG: hypothetical protein ACLFWG_00100 [Longimicrobiales bacterium]